MLRLAIAALSLSALTTGANAKLSCGGCMVFQESIWRTINHNISNAEMKNLAGTSSTFTLEVGQVIWYLCSSRAWTSMRYSDELESACKDYVRENVEMMTNYWQEKTQQEYQDASLALKMKRAVCPNPEIDACRLEQLPDDYSPLEADECAICEAVVADLFGIVQQTRDRPKKKLGDNYVRLLGLMGSVCEELPMRHPIRAKERDAVLELCQDIWEDHDSTLYQMAMKRSADFARTMCSQQLELCDDDLPTSFLYAHDPGRAPSDRDEM